jgi:hypothetical protein
MEVPKTPHAAPYFNVVKTESHIGLTVKDAKYAIGLLQANGSTP